jgi:hypothetical protein
MAHYLEHYENQVGGGGIARVYVGTAHQRGHGIGSFLGGLFRSALPLLKSGARALGKEALRAGVSVMEDMDNDAPFKEALKYRAAESVGNLRRKAFDKLGSLMRGSGYKTTRGGSGRQSLRGSKRKRVSGKTRGIKKRKTVKRGAGGKKK